MSRYLFWTLLFTGCSGYPGASPKTAPSQDEGMYSADSASDTASGELDDASAENDEAASVPAWFALDGELHVEGGELQSAVLLMRVYGEDTSVGVLDGCELSASVEGFTVEAATPDPMITHWWGLDDVTVHESWACGEQTQLPTSVTIGLGAFHPELNARVLPLELADPAASLYGFYASVSYAEAVEGFDSESAYIIGYGWTESTLAGMEDVSLDGTLPDGIYSLLGVFLLPLAP